MRKILISIPALLFSINVYAGLFGPSNYEECLLENMKGVTSDEAANAIKYACATKYSEKAVKKRCKERELTAVEKSKVSGNASISNYGNPYFSGKFYNGNKAINISAVTVMIGAANIKPPQEYNLFLQYPINPMSSGDAGISVQVSPTKDFEWGIMSMKTCNE